MPLGKTRHAATFGLQDIYFFTLLVNDTPSFALLRMDFTFLPSFKQLFYIFALLSAWQPTSVFHIGLSTRKDHATPYLSLEVLLVAPSPSLHLYDRWDPSKLLQPPAERRGRERVGRHPARHGTARGGRGRPLAARPAVAAQPSPWPRTRELLHHLLLLRFHCHLLLLRFRHHREACTRSDRRIEPPPRRIQPESDQQRRDRPESA